MRRSTELIFFCVHSDWLIRDDNAYAGSAATGIGAVGALLVSDNAGLQQMNGER
jgi:hypothetical protein